MTVTVITNTIIIKRDYSGVSGLMMERYFTKKFQEEGRYIVGKWWDRKGDNEIGLIVVDIIEKEAWIYEMAIRRSCRSVSCCHAAFSWQP